MIQFIQDYPGPAIALITVLSGAFGFFFKEYYSKKREQRELKAFLWKEKIQSAKKASEYYLEQMNFLNLLIRQFEYFELSETHDENSIKSMQKEVQFYSDKLKSFPHFEHHHVNIFYDLIEPKQNKLLDKIFGLIREQSNIIFEPSDSIEEIDFKIKKIRLLSKELKHSYIGIFNDYKDLLEKVRKDINKHI